MARKPITIEGLNPFQMELLDELWKMQSEEEYVLWFCLQDAHVQEQAWVLMQLLNLEMLEEELPRFQQLAQDEVKRIMEIT